MTTLLAAKRAGLAQLAQAGIAEPAQDVAILLAHVLGVDRGGLALLGPQTELTPAQAAALDAALTQRAARQPIAQITGQRLFWGRSFAVTRDVLDPRPETETLIEAALAAPAPRRILDLGTGSGALLVTLLAEWPEAAGLGIDASHAALRLAARNAARHGVSARAEFRTGDWCVGIAGRFDLVVCNPPYISRAGFEELAPDVRRWEPEAALTPGETGLESYRAIARDLAGILAPGGRALFEIGFDQGTSAPAVFREFGFDRLQIRHDLDGKARCIEISL